MLTISHDTNVAPDRNMMVKEAVENGVGVRKAAGNWRASITEPPDSPRWNVILIGPDGTEWRFVFDGPQEQTYTFIANTIDEMLPSSIKQ